MDGDTPRARGRGVTQPGDPSPPTYYAQHDPDGPARYSTTLVHALADVMGRDVTDVRAALQDCIDPGALDLLFPNTPYGVPGHVAFTVLGYRVTAYSDGRIVITPPADPSPGGPPGPDL